MKITVQPFSFYGKSLYAPLCDGSWLFVKLQRRMGKNPMITSRELKLIKELGFEVVFEYREPKEQCKESV